jgi:hypothetical protein
MKGVMKKAKKKTWKPYARVLPAPSQLLASSQLPAHSQLPEHGFEPSFTKQVWGKTHT